MPFTFLHTADWQIGKAFGSLPKEVAIALTEARLGAIDRLADQAERSGARHVLVAGDIFETETLSPKTIRQALARMGRHRDLVWHLLPGNHDAHRPGGLWEQLLAEEPPGNLRAHLAPSPSEIDPGVWLLPAPLTGRASAIDPTAYYDAISTPSGALRIGLAHGSVHGFGSDGDAAINISPNRAAIARLDYLALGDWHGVKQIEPRTWYSGTPEPDRFATNEPGHALVVRIEAAGAPPDVQRVRTAQFAWVRRELALRASNDLMALEAAVDAAAERPSDVLVQLVLSGRVTAGDRQEIGRRLKALDASLRYLDVDLSELTLKASDSNLEPLGAGGELRWVGEQLAKLIAEPSPEKSAVASEALTLLLELAAEAGGAGS